MEIEKKRQTEKEKNTTTKSRQSEHTKEGKRRVVSASKMRENLIDSSLDSYILPISAADSSQIFLILSLPRRKEEGLTKKGGGRK